MTACFWASPIFHCSYFKYEDSEIDQDVKSDHSVDENDPQFRCTLCKDKFKNLTDVEKHTYSYHQIIGKSNF